MWDSYKEKSENEIDRFDAHDHLSKLCEANNLALEEFAKVRYQVGWSELLSQLALELKDYPIRLIDIDDSHGQLDIKFEMLKKKNEVLVWHLLQYFKDHSRVTCMGCGSKSSNLKANGLNLRFCAECFKSAPKINKTGTWLDKF